jgi:hypothetical protein
MTIEDDGITAFKNFISQSLLFEPMINSNDKYPSWDGEIIVYNSDNHNKDNIKGRIPVQLKSAKRKIKRKETFSVKKTDLRNYYKEGGIILIRPIFTETTCYKIYLRLLLPVTIKAMLDNKKNKNASISIKLESIANIQSFESRCHHFLKNRSLQYNVNNIIDIEVLKNEEADFIIDTINEGSFADSILSENCFVYKQEKNITIPCNIKFGSVSIKKNSQVHIDKKVYFEEIISTKALDGSSYIQFNPVLRIKVADNVASIQINYNDENLFIDCLKAFRFLSGLVEARHFCIEDYMFEKISIKLGNNFENSLLLFENTLELLDIFRIKYDTLTLQMLNDKDALLAKLIKLFIENKEIQLNNGKDQFLQIISLFNTTKLIYLQKTEGSSFKAYNFFLDSIFKADFMIKNHNDEVPIPCSRYLALTTLEHVKTIDGFFKEAAEELIKYYDVRAFPNYEFFMLSCIKIYDETSNKDFLILANSINELINGTEINDKNKNSYIVNKFQLIKRERFLTKDEIKILLDIESKSLEDVDTICCTYILMEYFEKFEHIFETFDEAKKKNFKNWPIWNLYINSNYFKKTLIDF